MTPYRRVEIFTLSLYSFCALSQVSVSINEKKLLLKRKYHFNLKISGHYLRCDAIQERLLNSRFSKFTMGIWLCEWLRGQNFETAAQKIII